MLGLRFFVFESVHWGDKNKETSFTTNEQIRLHSIYENLKNSLELVSGLLISAEKDCQKLYQFQSESLFGSAKDSKETIESLSFLMYSNISDDVTDFKIIRFHQIYFKKETLFFYCK